MARLKIGTVTALLTPDEIRITPDDRQELIKTVEYSGGVFTPSVSVVDGGVCATGAILAASGVKFSAVDFATVRGYWENRTLVSVTDVTGTQVDNCRVKLTQWTENKKFDAITTDIEVWRV